MGRAATECRPYNLLQGIERIDTDHSSTAFGESAEVTEGLGLFEYAEGVVFTRNRKVGLVVGDDLKEHARVRTTFVKLSG